MRKRICAVTAMAGIFIMTPGLTAMASSVNVVDQANVLSHSTIQVMQDRESTVYNQKGIRFTTVVIKDGSVKGAAMTYAESAPSVVLVMDVANGTAGWYPNGITSGNPVPRIESLWMRGGRNLGRWDGDLSSAQAYAIAQAEEANIVKTPSLVSGYDVFWGVGCAALALLGCVEIWRRRTRKIVKSGKATPERVDR